MTDDKAKEKNTIEKNNDNFAIDLATATGILGGVGYVAGTVSGLAVGHITQPTPSDDKPAAVQLETIKATVDRKLESHPGFHTWSASKVADEYAKGIAEETQLRKQAASKMGQNKSDNYVNRAMNTGGKIGALAGVTFLPLVAAVVGLGVANKKRKQFMDELKKDRERELNERGIDR